jgi:hypothetical protein
MAMGQYLLIPFSGGWTSIYQLFWCELQGYKILTHCQISKIWNHRSDEKNATPLHLWIVVGCFWCTRRCVYAGRQPHGVSFHCTSACETIIWIQYQWFGLRENLQETIHFPISMEFSCKCQSLNQSIDSRWEFQTLTWLQNVDHVCRCLLYPSTDSCLTPAVHPAFFHSCQWKSLVSAGDVSNIVEHVFQFFVILHQPWSNDHYKYYNHL